MLRTVNGKDFLYDRLIYAITIHNMTVQLDAMSACMAFFSLIDKRLVLSYGESVLVNVYNKTSTNPEMREALFIGHDQVRYKYIVRVDDEL